MKRGQKLSSSKVPCIHYKECSACPLITYSYKDQLEIKRQKVIDAFRSVGLTEAQLQQIIKPVRGAVQTLGYRNKAKWILQSGPKGEVKMGIYKRGTHEVVDIPKCAVHADFINEISFFIKEQLKVSSVPCGSLQVGEPVLRYLIVRYSFREKKVLLVFVTSASKVKGLDQVFKRVEEKYGDKIACTVQNINSDSGNVLLGEANRYITKKGELTETMGSIRVPVGPLSFLQVNTKQAAILYQRVKQLIGSGPFEGGLDLYSGIALHAMHLAKATRHVLAVEEVGPAALEGVIATRRNKAHNVLQICGDALEGLQTYHKEWGTPQWIVINPPRKGCEKSLLEGICERPPEKLIYVSCNPQSLARDLKVLLETQTQFKLHLVEPIDMFPQTDHIECIALLENTNYKTANFENDKNITQRSSGRSQKNKVIN